MRRPEPSAGGTSRRSGLFRRGIRTTILPGLILVLGAWQILHEGLGTSAVPSPAETFATLADLARRDLAAHLAASLARVLAATALQILAGAGLGIALGASRRAELILGSSVRILHPVPKIAFLPVFMILFGIGDLSKILFVASVTVFQTVVSVRDGIAEIPGPLFLAARSLGLRRPGLLRHLYIPAVLPRIFTSLRLGLGMGLSALFFAENYATRYGAGYLIMNAYAMADYRTTFAGIVCLSLLALGLFALADLGERRLCPWLRAGKG